MTSSWTNWSGSVTCQPQLIAKPSYEDQLIGLVKQANAAKQTIRVVGTGHSFVPLCASDGLLLSLDMLQGIAAIDTAGLTATIWAGSKIAQLGEPLRQAGLAMENMGDIDRQALAGAISTGTHGTGRGLGSISTQVVGLRLITASGDVLDCSAAKDGNIFKAAQVSLGAIGVISQITLRLLPAYRLHEKTVIIPFAECFDDLAGLIASNRHFEFFWLPQKDVCAAKMLNPTQAQPHSAPGTEASAPPGTVARYLKEERIDHSDRIFPSERTVKFNEIEFAVPEANGPACLLEIRALMQQKYSEVVWPIEYRTLGADDVFLSPAYQRDAVTISVHEAHDRPYHAFFADVEAIFRNHQGRPHWGKVHTHTAPELQALYPQWDRFQAVRQHLDPEGRFLNSHLRSVFWG